MFIFSQWAHERSRVARAMVSLPIAEVEGVVKYAETPVVHWLDAYGKETPRYVPAPMSPLFLVLVSVAGGAVLGYLVFAARTRMSRNRS